VFSSHLEETSGRVFYVSPSGDDQNPGTKAKPFATLPRARDASRALKRAAPLSQPVTVRLTGGLHTLAEPFVLTPEDSAVTYEAAAGAHPVLSGGVRVTGWRKLNDALWVAEVPWVAKRAEAFTQLFVNGERRTCARTPNSGAYFYTKRLALSEGQPGPCTGMTCFANDVGPWIVQKGVRVVLFHNWVNSYNVVKTADLDKRQLVFARPAGIFFLGPEVRYYVENALELLDEPG
jgi:hypothetical protein